MTDYQRETYRMIMERIPEHRRNVAGYDAAQLALAIHPDIRHHVLYLMGLAASRPEVPAND